MTPDISRIIQTVLVEIISDKIVERLAATKHKALVLLDMSDAGIGDAFQELNKLYRDSWSLDVAASREVFDARPSIFPGQALAIPQTAWTILDVASPMTSISSLLADKSMLIVPNMSMALAGKVAYGISDDTPSRLMAAALETGKLVVAVKDACCPVCRDQDERLFVANDAYRAMMIANLAALDSFGVRLCRSPKLAQAVSGALLPFAPENGTPKPRQNTAFITPQALTSLSADSKGVFGWQDAKLASGSTVNIAKGVVVTPLALEELRVRNISVVRH